MRRTMLWAVAVAVSATAACDSPSEPRASEGPGLEPDGLVSAVVSDEAIVARATGSAHRSAAGAPAILSFAATTRADGTVQGEYYFRAIGTDPDQWLRVQVTCMTVVDGNKAWVAGITVDAFLPVLIGRVSYFYAFDNGEGANADADVVSLVRANDVAGADQEFCTQLPTVLPNADVLHGNVEITG
ncbi:MAG TPA: hypothetical protein VFZ24_12495 [Longimicrobiales bacterium]